VTLGAAFQNFWAAESLRLVDRAYRDAVNDLTSGVFGIESTGRVAFANRAGEEQIRQARWVRVLGGTLIPGNGVQEPNLFAKALRGLPGGISFKLLVTERLTCAQAIASGVPLSHPEPNPSPMSATALVWLTSVLPDEDVASDLAMLFDLTLAERRLVGRLIAGEDLREAALALHVSLHTARTQLKSIFGKTGRRTQATLLTFVTRLSALRSPSRTALTQ
jgi:DNA-binding CsgD family transcriptional regulator